MHFGLQNEKTISMLEELLSITEQFKSSMNKEERNAWQRISAKTADMREEMDFPTNNAD